MGSEIDESQTQRSATADRVAGELHSLTLLGDTVVTPEYAKGPQHTALKAMSDEINHCNESYAKDPEMLKEIRDKYREKTKDFPLSRDEVDIDSDGSLVLKPNKTSSDDLKEFQRRLVIHKAEDRIYSGEGDILGVIGARESVRVDIASIQAEEKRLAGK